MPSLRVFAGPSSTELTEITDKVNKTTCHLISSHAFHGQVVVNVKGLPTSEENHSDYFERLDRTGITWSIQVQGRFLQPHSANDILFGNTFDRPLTLPWGTTAALTFMSYIDPTLEHDLTSTTKPWALSPLVATMPHFSHTRISDDDIDELPPFPPPNSIHDNTKQLGLLSSKSNETTADLSTAALRRSFFADADHRKDFLFGPQDVISTDFCYGFLEFVPSLTLKLPGGISFDLERYWDGQPVRFVCCERAATPSEEKPWGNIFWCVSIEMDS